MEKFLPSIKTTKPAELPLSSYVASIVEVLLLAERMRNGKPVVHASYISNSINPTEQNQ